MHAVLEALACVYLFGFVLLAFCGLVLWAISRRVDDTELTPRVWTFLAIAVVAWPVTVLLFAAAVVWEMVRFYSRA
mgnify:FL=1